MGDAVSGPWSAPARTLVLYTDATRDRWRFALYNDAGIVDGALPELTAQDTAEKAQQRLVAQVQEVTNLRYDACWTVERPGWWTAELVVLGPAVATSPHDLQDGDWPAPWYPVDDASAQVVMAELRAECGPDHPLDVERCTVVGRSEAADDILVVLPGGGVAQVHLTWSHRQEEVPWPIAKMFGSFPVWLSTAQRDAARLLVGTLRRQRVDASPVVRESYPSAD